MHVCVDSECVCHIHIYLARIHLEVLMEVLMCINVSLQDYCSMLMVDAPYYMAGKLKLMTCRVQEAVALPKLRSLLLFSK